MKRVLLAASGDSRLPANQLCWPTQEAMEAKLKSVLAGLGCEVHRVHEYDPQAKHGFLDSQKAGLAAFAEIDRTAPIIVAESVWQYSTHILPGLINHRGPILTVANWSGQWPGLVGMLNLNGGLTKAGVKYSTLWSETFDDEFFMRGLKEWLETGTVTQDASHLRPFDPASVSGEAASVASRLREELLRDGAILAVFDEGCMGMYNAIIPDELLFPMNIHKERLSQSALLFGMSQVTDAEAEAVYQWIVDKGFTFHFGPDPENDLSKSQVIEQCRMYIAAARIADEFGCAALGIQYQLGLKDMCSASDLVEGLLNNSDRPPVHRADGSIIREGEPYTHFNEVDECAGVDGLFTQRIWTALNQPPENTLHDLRWGDIDRSGTVDDYVWVFEISGAAPAEHHGGYGKSFGKRQAKMYFPYGGSTLSGVAKPGEIVWSRIYVEPGRLCMDIGRGHVVELPEAETRRRLDGTTPQWPIMHAVLHGISRDQMMAKHKANHIQVAYAHGAEEADRCMQAKAALAHSLGIAVSVCGV
ncbi:MAG: hypothetical protein KF784_08455 [Fimbriimonadaceae bacterium]|nr:hypothetical protein [Fimbriimonadaceae bacterium]